MRPTLILALLALPCAALAGDAHRDHDQGRDQDRARAARDRGEAAPLSEILPRVEDQLGARVIEVSLERDDGRLIYEFELIAPDGRLLEAEVDARTGAVLDVEEDD